jgi:hypothetical protein
LQNIYCISHKHRQNNSIGILPAGIVVFCAHFLYVNPSVFEFFLLIELVIKC